MSEREVVLNLSVKAHGTEDVRATTQAVEELADAEKTYRLERDRPAYRTQRQQAADEMVRTYGMPRSAIRQPLSAARTAPEKTDSGTRNAGSDRHGEKTYRPERDHPAYKTQRQEAAEELQKSSSEPRSRARGRSSGRQQHQEAAADLLELHGAPAKPTKQSRDPLDDREREREQQRQQREQRHTRQQSRASAADLLELHGAAPELTKRMRGSVKDEAREIDEVKRQREEMLGLDQRRAADEADYQKALERTVLVLERAKRMKEDLTKRGAIDRELTEEEKYQKSLKQRIKDYETAKRMKYDLAQSGVGAKEQGFADHLGDRLGVPAGLTKLGLAAGGAALALKTLDKGVKAYYSSMERGEFSGEKFGQNARGWVENNVPVYGEWLKHQKHGPGMETNSIDNAVGNAFLRATGQPQVALDPTKQISTQDRHYLMFRSQQDVGLAGQRAPIQSETRRRQAGLAMELEGRQGEREAAFGWRREHFGISKEATGSREFAIEATRSQFGYGRSERLEDITGLIGYREQKAHADADSAAHLHEIEARQRQAERQAQRTKIAHRQAVADEQPLRARLAPLTEIGHISDRILALQTGARSTRPDEKVTLERQRTQLRQQAGTTVEEELKMRQRLQAMEAETAARRQEANETQQAALSLRVEKEKAITEAMKEQDALGRQYLGNLQAQAQALRKREKSLTEEMSLAHPMQLRTAVGINRKVKAGQQVTQREIDFMQGHKEWFGAAQLEKVSAQRMARGGQAAMVNELMQGGGVGMRRQALEKQIMEVKHSLQIDLKTDQAVIAQIAKKMAEAFHQYDAQISAQMNQRLNQVQNTGMAQRRAMFPQY